MLQEFELMKSFLILLSSSASSSASLIWLFLMHLMLIPKDFDDGDDDDGDVDYYERNDYDFCSAWDPFPPEPLFIIRKMKMRFAAGGVEKKNKNLMNKYLTFLLFLVF